AWHEDQDGPDYLHAWNAVPQNDYQARNRTGGGGADRIKVFDPGEHRITFDRGTLPSGMYCYRLETGTTSAARMMVLLP
ncbi:MAG: hypothetical protein Q8922_14500, partial [Bacteroidota bacterium]|nr:hypothetical protein [Bacteroidota bacterium]